MQEPRRPEVVLVRSSAPPGAPPPPRPAPPRRSWWLLSSTAFALLLAGTSTSAERRGPAEPLEVRLVATDQVAVSQSGVLVVPLELRNTGRPAAVAAAQVYAEPVRQDARVQAPRHIADRTSRGVVALLAPDCRLLRPGSPIAFRATVRLRLVDGAAVEDLVVDLGATAAVRRTVAGLCA